MAGYKVTTFDGVDLPIYDPEHDWTPPAVLSTLQRSIGGVFDRYGSTRRLPDQQIVEYTGKYVGETEYVVDADGTYVVDANGDNWIGGDYANRLRAQVEALLTKIGVRGQLIRQRHDDSVNQWKTARLLNVTWQTEHEERLQLAKVTPRFEIASGAWRDETITSVSIATYEGLVRLQAPNGGMIPIEDAIITFAATNEVTNLNIAATGIDWTFDGTIAAGTSLVIDCGAQTVLNNGADAYADFTINAAHSSNGWLPLAMGNNDLGITADDVGTITITYYGQWL